MIGAITPENFEIESAAPFFVPPYFDTVFAVSVSSSLFNSIDTVYENAADPIATTKWPNNKYVNLFVIPRNKRANDKNNKPWAILSIEGQKSKFEGFIFSSTYEKNKALLFKDSKLFFIAKPSNKNDDEK